MFWGKKQKLHAVLACSLFRKIAWKKGYKAVTKNSQKIIF